MKNLAKTALFAALAFSSPAIVGGQLYAQARSIAVADLEAAIQNSTAFTNAMTAMQTTYKPQFDQANARTTALNAELQPLITAFENARKAPGATEASVQPSFTALQNKRNAGQAELQRISQPIALARAYVVEQIALQMDPALKAAMRARSVDLVLAPGAAVSFQPTADITAAVTTELNRLVPSATIVPPAGWQPGQRQAAAQGAAPAQPARGEGR